MRDAVQLFVTLDDSSRAPHVAKQLASLAATPDMAGQLLTQVIQGLQLTGMAFTRNSLL